MSQFQIPSHASGQPARQLAGISLLADSEFQIPVFLSILSG